jgi:hypothetical protein
MAIILDDNAEVWRKYKDNLLQVYPYYYWVKEFENDEIRVVKHTEFYLHYLGSFLQRAITLYKRVKAADQSNSVKLQRVVRLMHLHLFSGLNVHFTCFVAQNNPEEVLTLREAKIMKQRHASITFEAEECNLIVANTFKATKKIKAAKAKGVPTVHATWIKYSVINLCPMSAASFDVSCMSEETLKDPRAFETRLFEMHGDE